MSVSAGLSLIAIQDISESWKTKTKINASNRKDEEIIPRCCKEMLKSLKASDLDDIYMQTISREFKVVANMNGWMSQIKS